MKLALLDELVTARAAKRAVTLATWLDGSNQAVLSRDTAPVELASTVDEALRTDRALVVSIADRSVLVEPHNPPLRLIIVGPSTGVQTLNVACGGRLMATT